MRTRMLGGVRGRGLAAPSYSISLCQKVVFFIHNTCYRILNVHILGSVLPVVVLLGLKAKDFKMLDTHIIQAIRETFREECIKDEIIEQFLNRSGGITYTKTRDRKHVARMNKACELVQGFEDLKLAGSINQSAMSIRISRLLVGDGPNRYIRPSEELLQRGVPIDRVQDVLGHADISTTRRYAKTAPEAVLRLAARLDKMEEEIVVYTYVLPDMLMKVPTSLLRYMALK